MNLGENIYHLRMARNMSQGDLADALDVSRQSVSKWENNNAVPDLEKLIKMSELFEITLDELVGRKNTVKTDNNSSEEESKSVQQVVIHHQFRPLNLRQIIGAILIFSSFLFVPLALSATSYKPTVSCLILFAAFILCGFSTILFRYPYIPCAWILVSAFTTYLFLLHHWEDAYYALAFIALALALMILWTIHAHISGKVKIPQWLWWTGGIILALLLILFCINFIPPFWIGSTSHPATPN